ncbi:MAG TPA: translation initiation factor IF-2 N-terminal domain-containing protein, partial [Candidatus Eisenbacteria bacterium]
MPNSPAAKKLRIYEVAKDLGMSSEVIQQIAKKLGVEVKNHMSTLTTEVVEKVRSELGKEKAAAREVVVRQQEHEAQRARDDRQRAQAAAQAVVQAQQAAAQ